MARMELTPIRRTGSAPGPSLRRVPVILTLVRRFLLLLLICTLAVAARAARLSKVVPPERTLTSNVIVVVDTSGSMARQPILTALRAD